MVLAVLAPFSVDAERIEKRHRSLSADCANSTTRRAYRDQPSGRWQGRASADQRWQMRIPNDRVLLEWIHTRAVNFDSAKSFSHRFLMPRQPASKSGEKKTLLSRN